MPYSPPDGSSIVLNWTGAPYTSPSGDSVVLEFSGTPDEQYIIGASSGNTLCFGTDAVENKTRFLSMVGVDALFVGQSVLQWTQFVSASGSTCLLVGGVTVDNADHYVQPESILSLVFGGNRFSGGQQTITVNGIDAPSVGLPAFYAQVWPESLGVLSAFGIPVVSPRIVYPYGIAGAIGTPRVQYPPRPEGWLSQATGSPFVDFKTKPVSVIGFECLDTGFPRIRDRAQTASPLSILGNGIFGDTTTRNTTKQLIPSGFDNSNHSDYSVVFSTRRYVVAAPVARGGMGLSAITNTTPQLFVAGQDCFDLPSPNIGYWIQSILPSGLDGQRFGSSKIAAPPELLTQGFAGEMGLPVIDIGNRSVTALGVNTEKYGLCSVTYFSRRINPLGIFQEVVSDKQSVEFAIRAIVLEGIPSSFDGGVVWVTRKVRSIQPHSIFDVLSSAHKIGGKQYVRPFGDTATLFGTRIIPEITAVYPQGIYGVAGRPTVKNRTQDIFPNSFLATSADPWLRFGSPILFNHRQIIVQVFDVDADLGPPIFMAGSTIENRSKTVSTFGSRANLHGLATVENTGRALLPVGVAAPATSEFYKAGMVTYRIRSLPLDGIEPAYFSAYNMVYNAARVLVPTGCDALSFGAQISTINTRRYFDRIGGMDVLQVTEPMIAPRIRTIQTGGGWYFIAPPDIRLPDVQLSTRYIDVAGKEYFGAGFPEAVIHWKIIAPKTNPHDRYGVAAVKNKTPEIPTFGAMFDIYGDTFIRLQWRPVVAQGANAQLFGRAAIADRKKHITVRSLGAGFFGDKLTVTKTVSPPYSLQNVLLDGVSGEGGDGIAPPNPNQVTNPTLQQNIIYTNGFDARKVGTAKVTANTIRVEPGYQDFTVGNHAVSVKIRTIAVKEFSVLEVFEPSPPRLSPHTIWAVKEAPPQAVTNNSHGSSGLELHYVDGKDHFPPGSVFGSPVVQLKNRVVAVYWPSSNPQSGYGSPEIFNRLSVIAPPSIKSMRLGWARLPSLTSLKQFASADSMEMGRASVAHPPYLGPQTLTVSGFDAKHFGQTTEVQLFNRVVDARGYDTALFGVSDEKDKPYAWQSLHVGEPLPTIPAGVNTSIFGAQWISLKIRNLEMTGFDAFLCEYQLEAFDKRLRVSGTPEDRPFRPITPVGISVTTFGVPNVKPAVQFIRPDGNAEQYRKGAQHV